MKKKLQVINTKSHGYVLVDDSEIKSGEILPYVLFGEIFNSNNGIRESKIKLAKKLIATSTEHKIEGVLQYIIVDNEAERLALDRIEEAFGEPGMNEAKELCKDFWIDGFKATKEKYCFSEEDMFQLWNMKGGKDRHGNEITFEQCIQSLKQPTLPDVVEVEYVCSYCGEQGNDKFNHKMGCAGKLLNNFKPKLNSQGLIEIKL